MKPVRYNARQVVGSGSRCGVREELVFFAARVLRDQAKWL